MVLTETISQMLLLSPVHVPLKQCFLVTVPQFSIEIPTAAGKMARVMGAKPRNRWLFLCSISMCNWPKLEWFWMVLDGFLASQEPTRVQPAIDFRFGFWKRVEGFLGTKTAKTESRDGCRCTSLTQNPGVSAIFLAMSTRQFGSLVNCQDLASKHSDFHGVTWKTEMPEDVTVQWFLNLTLW